MSLAQHDHGFDIGVNVGPLGLRVAMLGIVFVVAGYALLKPFLPGQPVLDPRWLTAGAGCGVLLVLLLSTGPTMPRQLIAVLLTAVAVPIYASFRRADVPAVRLQRAAPAVLALTGAGSAVLFARGLLFGAGPAAVAAGLALALAGLSWLVLCRPRSRLAGRLCATAAWLQASAAVAGAGFVSMLAVAGG